ncbi:MAG: hypothetical protein COZ06_33950 [Armatimonadetes bacterium CG_4_10_14_3_um_filter_66_18]|nr:hypothetical protein [Armatimonadota bacterium]OIP11761.1 MAG: hypothetical protein AUJ96_01745 [Armatimonadetes bacterium CG2_30_66_41]PIU93994.1 MAG: hypothetical protein COS65_10000 [Armatimonadetes bacterium CG06_land_8_20_14_3_00_66_21]PIX37126.1 MAG: hypothetical protein COZ57_35950 [Armatimonadetes bacterium CG_4_8_14_3_um_filter_66_20]PIY36940.1 MAG: hypothetical protein COZ06_33950 [Armatimonadetes bacterium CG_4_10_14_3_um_filter_66_18]PIZ32153.1 MAG: hypothetical protein COY42_31
MRTGRGYAVSLDGTVVNTNAAMYFAEHGMTVVNEEWRPLTRVIDAKGLALTLADPIAAADLPDANGDGKGRFLVMAIGPGDRITFGSTTRHDRAAT